MKGLLRCTSTSEGEQCAQVRWHFGWHKARPAPGVTLSWRHGDELRQTYETTAPWVTWLWLSSDRETRITGRSLLQLTCAVCGKRETVRIRIPRVGPVPEPIDGIHPARKAAIARHAHPERGHPMSWAKPLLNPAAHTGGVELDLLAMRLDADVNATEGHPLSCPAAAAHRTKGTCTCGYDQ